MCPTSPLPQPFLSQKSNIANCTNYELENNFGSRLGAAGWIIYNILKYVIIQYNILQYNILKYNILQYNTLQYVILQYVILQYNILQYNIL